MSISFEYVVKDNSVLEDCPCKRGCQERSWDCHGKCEKYLEWDANRREERESDRDNKTVDIYSRNKAFRKEKGKRGAKWRIRGKI